mgnify:CR=1 FL=1
MVALLAAQQGDAAATPPPQTPPTSAGSPDPDSNGNAPDPDGGQSADGHQETQTERNEQRDDVPKPTKAAAGKDGPKTTRVGAKA